MRYFLLSILLLPALLHAQTSAHNSIWYFGCGHTVQFTPTGPVAGAGIPPVPAHDLYSLHSGVRKASIAVCNSVGELQFFVQTRGIVQQPNAYVYSTQTQKVFDRNGQPFPNGNIETNGNESANPLVVPHQANYQQYYLLHFYNGALQYSLVDMSLNGGLGDIVPNEKDIKLTGYGEVIARKVTTVRGCSGRLWLVARSRTENAYYSFAFGSQGLDTTRVVSYVGTQPINSYRTIGAYFGGILTASNKGHFLAAGTNAGIEVCDFEGCSGRVKNARMLDTLPIMGLCFSPDDTKLYASAMERWSLWNDNPPTFNNYVPLGRVYQYDLLQPNPVLSRTQVLENYIKVCLTIGGYTDTVSSWLGDIKCGTDGKLYVASNTKPCNNLTPIGAIPVPPSTNVVIEQSLHCIHQPNQTGMACMPQHNAVLLHGSPVLSTGFMLQQEIMLLPEAIPDTLPGSLQMLTVCYQPEQVLAADTTGACYTWDDGSTDPTRTVTASGQYWVRYFKGCSIQTDSFEVHFVPLPPAPQLIHACPGEAALTLAPVDTQRLYSYTLRNANGHALQRSGTGSQQFTGLGAGNYTLEIQSGTCDTVLHLTIEDVPAAELVVSPTDTTIYYGAAVQLQVSGAYIYTWWPTATLDSATSAQPIASPLKPTRYEVIGINEFGCRDTAYVWVDINYDMPELVPNAFSPNGDGLNDVFRLGGITYQKLHLFQVFNRYGQEVYRGQDASLGWDGTYRGQPCELGTYYYLIQLVYPNGSTKTYKGDVLLLR